jgi:hypothetical protein
VVNDRQPRRSALDEGIDELYRRPLAEFTAARNALAKTLAGADAQRVKRLAKPTLIPWTINQVYWTARSVYDHLIEAGAEVRRAQIAALEKPGTTAARVQKSRDEVRKAVDAHQKAVAGAVHQALRAAAKADAHPPVDALTRMLESLSLAPTQPDFPGRLTELVQPAGFEALTGVTPAFSLDAPPSRATRPSGSPSPSSPVSEDADSDEPDSPAAATSPGERRRTSAASKRETAAVERERQKVIKEARHALAQARESEHRARAKMDRTAAAVLDAERKLAHEREALKAAQNEVDEAERTRQAAEHAVKAHGAG